MSQPSMPDRYFVQAVDQQVRELVDAYRADAAAARVRIAVEISNDTDRRGGTTDAALTVVRELYGARLAAIVARLDAQMAAAQAAAAALLATPATGVEALLTRQAWWSRIRTMIDSGMTPNTVIRSATDPELLFALRDEVPTQLVLGSTGFDPGTDDRITARLAQLAGQVAVDAQEALQDSEQALSMLRPALDKAAAEIGATDHRHTSQADFADAIAQYGLRPRSSF
jgi:hypothetical protein